MVGQQDKTAADRLVVLMDKLVALLDRMAAQADRMAPMVSGKMAEPVVWDRMTGLARKDQRAGKQGTEGIVNKEMIADQADFP